MNPLVSVILPSYNHELFIRKRIESILNQNFYDFELIIIDDCSTDNSKAIIEEFRTNEHITNILYNTVNSGCTFVQWKKGLELAKGDFIWIAESDDYCELNFLDVLSKILLKNNEIAIAYSKTIRVDELNNQIGDLSFWYNDLSKKRWKKDYSFDGNKEIEHYLIYKNTIPNASAVLFRKESLKHFDDNILDFKVCGDWYFWISILNGHKIYYSTETINYFRTHSKSVRNTKGDLELINSEKKKIRSYIIEKKIISDKVMQKKIKNKGISKNNFFIQLFYKTKDIFFSN